MLLLCYCLSSEGIIAHVIFREDSGISDSKAHVVSANSRKGTGVSDSSAYATNANSSGGTGITVSKPHFLLQLMLLLLLVVLP